MNKSAELVFYTVCDYLGALICFDVDIFQKGGISHTHCKTEGRH